MVKILTIIHFRHFTNFMHGTLATTCQLTVIKVIYLITLYCDAPQQTLY